jgi:hypothetical protein
MPLRVTSDRFTFCLYRHLESLAHKSSPTKCHLCPLVAGSTGRRNTFARARKRSLNRIRDSWLLAMPKLNFLDRSEPPLTSFADQHTPQPSCSGLRCCVDQLRPPSGADICGAQRYVRSSLLDSDRKSGLSQWAMSALPLKADMCSAIAYVCFGPIADLAQQFMNSSSAQPSVE